MTDIATLERQLAEAQGEIRELEALLEWTRREVRRETVMPVRGRSWTLPEHEAIASTASHRMGASYTAEIPDLGHPSGPLPLSAQAGSGSALESILKA